MRMLSVFAAAAAFSGTVALANPAGAQTSGMGAAQEQLRALQRDREEVMGYLRAYWTRNPISTTCAMVGLGSAASVIMEQADDTFRTQMDDRMRAGRAWATVGCGLYCFGAERAQCGDAALVLGEVAWWLYEITGREKALRGE